MTNKVSRCPAVASCANSRTRVMISPSGSRVSSRSKCRTSNRMVRLRRAARAKGHTGSPPKISCGCSMNSSDHLTTASMTAIAWPLLASGIACRTSERVSKRCAIALATCRRCVAPIAHVVRSVHPSKLHARAVSEVRAPQLGDRRIGGSVSGGVRRDRCLGRARPNLQLLRYVAARDQYWDDDHHVFDGFHHPELPEPRREGNSAESRAAHSRGQGSSDRDGASRGADGSGAERAHRRLREAPRSTGGDRARSEGRLFSD